MEKQETGNKMETGNRNGNNFLTTVASPSKIHMLFALV